MDLLIDLDGTLVDPKAGIIASVQFALATLGCEVPEADVLTWVIGPPLRVTFPKLGVNAADVERAVALYRENYTAAQAPAKFPAMFLASVYQDIPEALAALTDAGHRLIVCTSKPHVYARPILEHFQLATAFAAIHGSELDGRHDDKAELIAHIIQAEAVDPRRALMIGDRMFDIKGAKANALRSIGVTWGYAAPGELVAAGANVMCRNVAHLAACVAALDAA
jgi:phosphoglycolate phosphatase